MHGASTGGMTRFGYHASHEQYRPSDLLEYLELAEEAGFQSGSCSDHFHPWTEAQGQSGFAWSWLGAALHATSIPLGTVNGPGYRYQAARFVRPNDVAHGVRVSADLARHSAWLHDYVGLGIDDVYVFNVNRGQRAFIEVFGERVLPELAKTAKPELSV
jgi:hypothetical protein